jgi:hypothetical protein
MARTAVTTTTLTSAKDATLTPTALPAGNAIDPTNGHNVANAFAGKDELFIYVDHTTASTKLLTVRAGANPPALRAGIGDLTFTLAATTKYFLGPFEAAQFAQADGSLNLDFAASATGTLYAIKIKRDV